MDTPLPAPIRLVPQPLDPTSDWRLAYAHQTGLMIDIVEKLNNRLALVESRMTVVEAGAK